MKILLASRLTYLTKWHFEEIKIEIIAELDHISNLWFITFRYVYLILPPPPWLIIHEGMPLLKEPLAVSFYERRFYIYNSGGSRLSRRGRWPRGGHQLLRRLCFKKFVCQNERIWTLGGGGGCAPAAPPGSANVKINFSNLWSHYIFPDLSCEANSLSCPIMLLIQPVRIDHVQNTSDWKQNTKRTRQQKYYRSSYQWQGITVK